MNVDYEELDFRETPLGDLVLRRRRILQLGGVEVYEVKLGEYFLMSSLFHEAEAQLATLALGALDRDALDVVVGGLGLGYTAVSALEEDRVRSLVVAEYLEPVIAWHRDGLVPLGERLTRDARCRLIHADFFALSRDVTRSFDPDDPGKKHDAILVDIDHTPTHVLHASNARFYSDEGLGELAEHLTPGGVFALWADGRPDPAFTERIARRFADAKAHTIEFENPLTGGTAEGSVYVARTHP